MYITFPEAMLLGALVFLILGIPLLLLRRKARAQDSSLAELERRLGLAEASQATMTQALEQERAALFENRKILSQLSELPGTAAAMFDENAELLWNNHAWDGNAWKLSKGKKLSEQLASFTNILEPENADQLDQLRPGQLLTLPVALSSGGSGLRRGHLSVLLCGSEAACRLLISFRDTTQEQREIDHLQSLKARTDAVLASGGWGTWDWETAPNRCHWDQRAEALFGAPASSYENWLGCFHKADIPQLETHLRSALLGYHPVDVSIRSALSPGRHLSLKGRVMRDAQGKPERIAGVVADISDELLLREQLRLVGERLRLSLAGARDGIWQWDAEMEEFVVDEHWLALTGCKQQDLTLPRDVFEALIHPEDLNLFRSALEAQNDKNASMLDLECRVNSHGNDWVWLRWRAAVVSRESSGRARSVCGTYSDVTERHRNEEALRRSALLLRQVCQQMGIAAWELDASTFTLQWTEELDLLHAMPADFEPSLEGLLAYYPPDARRELTQAIDSALEADGHFDIEVRWIPPGTSTVLWYRWTGHPVRTEGRVVAVCGLIQDVTSTREAAAQRRNLDARMSELKQYEALSAITDDLAYDLNSLLVSLLGYQELAYDEMPAEDKAREYIHEALRTANRTHDIIKQVLLLNRVKPSARIGLKPQLLLEEVCERLRGMLSENVSVEREIDRQCPSVLGDAAQLEQAFLNLSTQAASVLLAKTGTMSLHLNQETLDLETAGQTGLAIAGEFMHLTIRVQVPELDGVEWLRLYEHPLRDPGLQIAAARKIISDHKGVLEVRADAKDSGSCHVYLPLSKTLRGHPPETEPMPRGHGESIWIMDEERFVARLAKLFLERNGYTVRLFRSQSELMPYLEDKSHECAAFILGSAGNRVESRRNTLEELRRLAPGLPLILLGGLPPQTSGLGAIQLAEPFTAADLARAVHEALHPSPGDLRILGGPGK